MVVYEKVFGSINIQECILVGCVAPTASLSGGGGLASSPSTSPWGIGCEPGPDPPQLPPWLWAWRPPLPDQAPPLPGGQNSWHTLLKILPCPKLRLRAVIINTSDSKIVLHNYNYHPKVQWKISNVAWLSLIGYRSGAVNSKSFGDKDFLRIKQKFKLTVHFKKWNDRRTFHRNFK